MKQYNKSNIQLARTLRKNMTPWENKLWYQFLRGYPVKFYRQRAIGNYIVDFYCAKARLVIELDGGGHYDEDKIKLDALRTEQLKNQNIIVVRICNTDIDKNFSGVCEYIDSLVKENYPSTTASHQSAYRSATRTCSLLHYVACRSFSPKRLCLFGVPFSLSPSPDKGRLKVAA